MGPTWVCGQVRLPTETDSAPLELRRSPFVIAHSCTVSASAAAAFIAVRLRP